MSPAGILQQAQNNPQIVLNAVSAANTAAASSAAIDMLGYEGVVEFIVQTGAITGTLDLKLQDCDTSGGTYADVSGATAAQVTAANKLSSIKVDVRNVRRFIKLVGTVVTGPVLISAIVCGAKKYRP